MNQEHKTTSLEELYEYLKRFSLSDSLLVISVANNAFKYGHRIMSDDTNKNVVAWIESFCKDPIERAAVMMNLTRLARFLLLSNSNDHKDKILDTGTTEMSRALNLTSSLYEKEVEGDDIARIMGRIGQWQFPLQADRSEIIGQGYLLFLEIPSGLDMRYDFDQKMIEYFGLDVLQFIASGLAAWLMSTGVLKYKLKIELDPIKDVVTTETLDKFVELSSGSPQQYRQYVRGNNWKHPNKLLDIYNLDPFLAMPAIRVERSLRLDPGQYVVPQPLYLLKRASLGIYHLLGDKEKERADNEGKKGKNEFKEIFGDVYREYVRRQLSLGKHLCTFIDLDHDIDTTMTRPDFALIKDGDCILFEIKTSFLTIDSRILFDSNTARIELDNPTGNFRKALTQLNSFEEAILDGQVNDVRFNGISRVIKILVGFEDLYLANAFLLPLIRELYGERAENLQIATLSDIEIIGASFSNDGQVIDAIREKVGDQKLCEWSLGMYIYQRTKDACRENPILKKAFEDFVSLISGKDYTNDNDPFVAK